MADARACGTMRHHLLKLTVVLTACAEQHPAFIEPLATYETSADDATSGRPGDASDPAPQVSTGGTSVPGNDEPPGDPNDPDDGGTSGTAAESTSGGDVHDASTSGEEQLTEHRVFLSSVPFAGAMGSLDGADELCTGLAADAGLGGTWRAILGAGNVAPMDRIDIGGTVYDLEGAIVALDATDMWDGELSSSITLDEHGLGRPATMVWTGFEANGEPADLHCAWWSNGSAGHGTIGSSGAPSNWTGVGQAGCDTTQHVYCIEQ